MNAPENEKNASTPVHLWVIGVVTLLWNAMGAFDFVMTQTHNEEYMAAFTPEQLEFFLGFPVWLVAFWVVAVFGGLLGSALLLMRNIWAFITFCVSFAAMMVTAIHNMVLSNGIEIMGTEGAIFSGVIFLVALGLVFYAHIMRVRGVLR